MFEYWNLVWHCQLGNAPTGRQEQLFFFQCFFKLLYPVTNSWLSQIQIFAAIDILFQAHLSPHKLRFLSLISSRLSSFSSSLIYISSFLNCLLDTSGVILFCGYIQSARLCSDRFRKLPAAWFRCVWNTLSRVRLCCGASSSNLYKPSS